MNKIIMQINILKKVKKLILVLANFIFIMAFSKKIIIEKNLNQIF